jgi:uncharacterized protein (TIGR02118 family)
LGRPGDDQLQGPQRHRHRHSGDAGPYQVIAVIGFESLEAFQAAAKESGKTVMGDIANFTDVTPVVQINEDLD